MGSGPVRSGVTVRQVFLLLLRDPLKYLLRRWNWKSALLSSLMRASLFFATNLAAGLPAAIAAMKTELVFRAITSGFYGALTESFREAEPPWTAALTVMLLLPLAWIIHDFTGEKRKDALKGVMNTGFWRTRHSLSEHPRDDISLYTTAVVFLLPTPNHSC
jgi:hypothetical protein